MNGIACAFTAHITSDPELRFTATGKPLLNISAAVEMARTKDMAEPPPTEWVRIVCWEALAEELGAHLAKGDAIYVEGRLKLNEWTSQDGQHRAGLNVSAWKVEPLGKIGHRAPRRPTPTETDQALELMAPRGWRS